MSFDYTLDEKRSWPPMGRPKAPFGPTIIEEMRDCILRSCFESSRGYERRLGNAARIGTALHRTLQSLNQYPISAETNEQLAAETRWRFQAEIREQQVQAASRPREQTLVWDQERTHRALEAVIAETIRTQPLGLKPTSIRWQPGTHATGTEHSPSPTPSQAFPVEVEVEVVSKDQLFHGRVDRAERLEVGVRLVEYKSAVRDNLPERYSRQLQLYAYLWHETRGEWPTEALVYYPMVGTFHNVPVDEATCQKVVQESMAIAYRVGRHVKPSDLASPGDVCKVCDFRPWCHPFWIWQSKEKNQLRALDRAAIGFEAQVKTIKLENHYWTLILDWNSSQAKLIAPQERFPYLLTVATGQTLRILDTTLKGQLFQPNVQIGNLSEIFISC
jgi:CRISPR/Cas system-associated exonuclease Cas4 (RecB family)